MFHWLQREITKDLFKLGFIIRLLFAKTLVVCQFNFDANGEDKCMRLWLQ